MNGKIHGTGIPAGFAGDACFFFPADLYQTEAVEPAVNGAQRAEILTEGPVNFYGEQQNQKKDPELPEEEAPDLASQQFIGREKGQCAQKRAGGAQIFAKCGNSGEAAKQKQRSGTYKKYKDCIFSIF